MTDEVVEKLRLVEELQETLSCLTDAVLILEKKTPDKYSDLDKSDRCVRRAVASLEDEELIDAFKRKIKTLKQEMVKLLS